MCSESGKYKSATGSGTCTDCPSKTSTATSGASSFSECLCNAGYSGSNGDCTECALGTFKSALGSGACVNCPSSSAGSVTTEFAARTAQGDCRCNLGFVGPNGGTCAGCAAGTYKSIMGSMACTACNANSNSPSGSDNNDDCTCNTAFDLQTQSVTTVNSVTVYLDKYIYKIIFSTSAGTRTYGGVGGTPVTQSINAGEFIVGVSYKRFIAANFGPYIGCGIILTTSHGRTLNFAGTLYDNLDDNGNAINDCATEQFFAASAWEPATGLTQASVTATSDVSGLQTQTRQFCAACTMTNFVDDCTCAAGMTRDSATNACVMCGAGKFKETTGTGACQNCPAGMYKASAGVNTACDDCIAGKFKSTSGVNSDCDNCEAGKFKSSSGVNTACDECELGKYKAASGVNTACDQCAAGKYKGAQGVNKACDPCEAGKYKAAAGTNTACDECEAGKYKAASGINTACDDCPAGRFKLTAGVNIECTLCAAGTYKVRRARQCECDARSRSGNRTASARSVINDLIGTPYMYRHGP